MEAINEETKERKERKGRRGKEKKGRRGRTEGKQLMHACYIYIPQRMLLSLLLLLLPLLLPPVKKETNECTCCEGMSGAALSNHLSFVKVFECVCPVTYIYTLAAGMQDWAF